MRLLETDRTRTKKNVTETILKIFQFLLDWTFWVPKVTNISFLPTILQCNVSSREYDMRMNTENGHLVARGKILSTDLFNWSQILSTDSLMECMEVTQKNLLVDIGAKGVRVKWYTSGGSRRGLKILWVTRNDTVNQISFYYLPQTKVLQLESTETSYQNFTRL